MGKNAAKYYLVETQRDDTGEGHVMVVVAKTGDHARRKAEQISATGVSVVGVYKVNRMARRLLFWFASHVKKQASLNRMMRESQ